MFAPDGMVFGMPVACAGAGALAAGLVALVGLGEGRTLVIPPVVVGAIFLATGLVMRAATFDPAIVLTTTMTLVVMAGSVFPWLALGATGTTVDQLYSTQDITADPDEIDPTRVSADARVAHEILVAVSATVGLLLVIIAPLAVSLGVSGTVLAVMCCLVVMLRTRQYRTGTEVLVGLVSGILGLLSVGDLHAVAAPRLAADRRGRPVGDRRRAARRHPPAVGSVRTPRPVRRHRRVGGLLSLLPLLVLATGVFSRSEADVRWPPRRTSSRPTRSAGAGWSRRSSPVPPAVARWSPRDRAAPSSAALALAVLLIAGAAIAGIFSPKVARRLDRAGPDRLEGGRATPTSSPRTKRRRVTRRCSDRSSTSRRRS